MTGSPSLEKGTSSATALIVLLISLWAVVILPFRAMSHGFRPPDDARRHVAKVLSGKQWQQVLVLRPEATVDPHPGWHALLTLLHRAGLESRAGLMLISMAVAAVGVLALPLLLWRGFRSEAWLLALLIVALAGWGFFKRALLGRPLLVTMAVLLAVLVLWPRLQADRTPRGVWLTLTAGFALSAWVHGNWYLWALPIGCFVLARELRVAGRLAVAAALGVALGALATGQPLEFLRQTLLHPLWALGSQAPTALLVGEFRPSGGAVRMVGAVLGLLAWRRTEGGPLLRPSRDPVLLLAFMGWALGQEIMRFWWDWGLPACLIWMAREIDASLALRRLEGRRRLLFAATVGAVLVLTVTADASLRWSSFRTPVVVSAQDPEQREWLPEKGGTLYNSSMDVFYDLFLAYPRGEWRYMLGFEPALMPPEDLRVYRRIQESRASNESLLPWARKLRREDRLFIHRRGSSRPEVPGIEWASFQPGYWIGRLRRSATEMEGRAAPQVEDWSEEGGEPLPSGDLADPAGDPIDD